MATITSMELPNAAQRLWIYGTATANELTAARERLAHGGALALHVARVERELRELLMLLGEPYHDPAASRMQADARRAEQAQARFAGH